MAQELTYFEFRFGREFLDEDSDSWIRHIPAIFDEDGIASGQRDCVFDRVEGLNVSAANVTVGAGAEGSHWLDKVQEIQHGFRSTGIHGTVSNWSRHRDICECSVLHGGLKNDSGIQVGHLSIPSFIWL